MIDAEEDMIEEIANRVQPEVVDVPDLDPQEIGHLIEIAMIENDEAVVKEKIEIRGVDIRMMIENLRHVDAIEKTVMVENHQLLISMKDLLEFNLLICFILYYWFLFCDKIYNN